MMHHMLECHIYIPYQAKTLQIIFPSRIVGSCPFGQSKGREGTFSEHIAHLAAAP